MLFSKAFAAVLAGVGFLADYTTAHSSERNPLSYISRIDDAVIHTPSHRVHAHSAFEVTFLLHDRKQKIRLSLEPNHDILSDDASVQYIDNDGKVHKVEPIERRDHRVFKGSAFFQLEGRSEWTNAGWARLSVQQDGPRPLFEGAFKLDGVHHHIQTSKNYMRTRLAQDPKVALETDDYMVIWRDSDVIRDRDHHGELKRGLGGQSHCSSDELAFNHDPRNPVYGSQEDTSIWARVNPRDLFGRQQLDGTAGGNGAGVNLADTIGSTDGCPTTRRIALVGIATDCTYAQDFENQAEMRDSIIKMVNTASQLFESTFNISLGIQNLTITAKECPSSPPASAPWNLACSDSVSINSRLNTFSQWRGQSNDNNAFWTLLTDCPTGNAVGLAWLGQVCQVGSAPNGPDTTAGANVVVRTSTEWQVFAHEVGHTFGAAHDCTSGSCNDGSVTRRECCPLSRDSCDTQSDFIMNPSTASGITNFSPCSVGNVCSFLGRNSARANCLANNRDVTTITGSQCGNGIVESGEECDCGGESGCGDNPCCNPETCRFTSGSVCDPTNDECCDGQCQLRSAGSVCRPSTGDCDPEETCSGSSALCPSDTTSPDGTKCGNSDDGLTCASGQCTSRDLQCKTIMGSLTKGNDTYSCNSQGCVLSCASPEFGPGTCYKMQQYFRDGTDCEGGGTCSNGVCTGSTVGNKILSWINDNKQIFIPVAVVVGLLLVLAITSCIWNCCRRSRVHAAPKPRRGPGPGWSPIGAPPNQPMRMGHMPAGGPMEMRTAYQGAAGGQQPDGRFEPMRTRSFRYA